MKDLDEENPQDTSAAMTMELGSQDAATTNDFRRIIERSYDMEMSDRDVIDGSLALPIGLVQIVLSGYAALAFGFLGAGRDFSDVIGGGLLVVMSIGLSTAVWSGALLFRAIGGRYAFLPEARVLQEFHEDCLEGRDALSKEYFWSEYERIVAEAASTNQRLNATRRNRRQIAFHYLLFSSVVLIFASCLIFVADL